MPETEPEPASPPEKLHIKRPEGEYPVRKRVRKPAPLPLYITDPEPTATGGPTFLRVLLWIALVGWLLFLALKLLDPLPFLFPDEANVQACAWWQVEREVPAPAIAHETDVEPGPEDAPALHALKLKVAAAILKGSSANAIGLIERQQRTPEIYPYQDDLAELANFVRDVSRMNAAVADAIRERIDQEVVLRVKNRRVTLIPRASAGTRINALLIPSRTNKPRRSVTFTVTDLDPIERAHWIGPADTPRACTMKLLLHVAAGDRDGARVFAPRCGLLAKAFEAELGKTAPSGRTKP